jgi:hypothetical protein
MHFGAAEQPAGGKLMDQGSWTAFLSLMLVVGPVVPQPLEPLIAKAGGNLGVPRMAQAAQAGMTEPQGEPLRVTIHPGTLGYAIDEFAGQRVRIPNARVASVLDPRAFVIESAVRYDVGKGFRDRILVLIDGASLRVTAEQVDGSTVVVLGVAKTIVGSRLLTAPAWPAALDRERMNQLEVRAVVVATSVQTADGTELTQ